MTDRGRVIDLEETVARLSLRVSTLEFSHRETEKKLEGHNRRLNAVADSIKQIVEIFRNVGQRIDWKN